MRPILDFLPLQSNATQQDDQVLITIRKDCDVREERCISLAQVAQFNQSAMFQLFGVAPIILQNGEAANLTSTDLVHILGALCLKTPAAWYSLVTFVLKSNIDLITLAALDHSTLLSEAVSLDVLMELFYSTGLLGLSGRAYYCATHLLTLGPHSIFGSGNVLLVVKDGHEILEDLAMSPSALQRVRLVTSPSTRRRIVKLALSPFYVEANLQPDQVLSSIPSTSQVREFGLITRVTPASFSVTTTSCVYANLSLDLLPYSCNSDIASIDPFSMLLQGVLLTIEPALQQESSDNRYVVTSVRLYPTYLSEFVEILSIEPCIPSSGASAHAKKLEEQPLSINQSPAFTPHASSTKAEKVDPPKALKDMFWAAAALRVTVAGYSFIVLVISRLSRLLYEVLIQIGSPLYCLWTVSDLCVTDLYTSSETPSLFPSWSIRAFSLLHTGLLIVDLQLPIRFYGKVNNDTSDLLLEVATTGREHQLFNISAAQYKSLIGFITRTAPVSIDLDVTTISSLWSDIRVVQSCSTNHHFNSNNLTTSNISKPSVLYLQPFAGIYSHLSRSLNVPCQSCSSVEEHELLLRTAEVSCSLCGGLSAWTAVVCAHVARFTVPVPFEVIWYASTPLVFLSSSALPSREPNPGHFNTVRERVLKAMLSHGINRSNSSAPCVFIHTNTLMGAILRYISLSGHAGSSHSADPSGFPILEEGDSLLGQCTCAELFFNGENICLTEIEVISLRCKGTGSISFDTSFTPLLRGEQAPTKTILPTISSVPDSLMDVTGSPTNPFLVSNGINLSTPKYYSDQTPESLFDPTFLEEMSNPLSPSTSICVSQQQSSSVPQFKTSMEQGPPGVYHRVDSGLLFPLTNSNSNSMLLFPAIDAPAPVPSNPFITSSAVSTPKRTFFPVITNITDMSELSSDVRTHSYLNPQTASDTTRTNGLSCYDENHSTTGSLHESIDLLATLDCSRHLFFSQDMTSISPEGLRSVVGYVRYHFPSFNLAVISFEDSLRADGWIHSLAIWTIPTSMRNSRICYRKTPSAQGKQGKNVHDDAPEFKRPFFARARVRCTVVPFNRTSAVYIALDVCFLDYYNPCDGVLTTKDPWGKIKRGKRQAAEGAATFTRTIHASVYWQESTKRAEMHTSFGFVRLCNGYERHFSTNAPTNYLGHLVTITLTSHNKTHRNTCELHESLLRPPIQQHWLIGRLVFLLRGKECEQIGQHVLDLMNGSFRTKIVSSTIETPGRLSKMMLVMGFIITECYQNTHVDCSFFRLILPKLVADRLEVGMLLRYTLKEGAYHKVMDISDSLYSSPCNLLNDILKADGTRSSELYEVDVLPNGAHVYMIDQAAPADMLEGNSRRLSCWAVDNISFVTDTFKGAYRYIESRKCRGIEPEESFFVRYGRYLSSNRATLIYLPRPALEVQPSLFSQSEVYFYMVHFVYNEQKSGVSAEANSLVRDITKGRVLGPKVGRIYPLKLPGMGHNNVVYLFIPESISSAISPTDILTCLLQCILSAEKFSSKSPEHMGAYIVPTIALLMLHSRLFMYARQLLKMEEFSSAQRWARCIMDGVTTGSIPVVASDARLSLKFTRELFMNGVDALQFETIEAPESPTASSLPLALVKKFNKPCFWCYTVQTVSVRNPPVHATEFLGPHTPTPAEAKSTYPCDSLEF
ncbi:Hypothetical protein GLP15_224 [Giardia lamblia P15]|uniref:Uncharacterized protein n=1 Tax=Giardia intestinalis (strain P15) TaxID=658858 RepID=E1F1J5_GIAIA|nr:Hypothetical protein GLP15_224 [Giardia lamblia P15]